MLFSATRIAHFLPLMFLERLTSWETAKDFIWQCSLTDKPIKHRMADVVSLVDQKRLTTLILAVVSQVPVLLTIISCDYRTEIKLATEKRKKTVKEIHA